MDQQQQIHQETTATAVTVTMNTSRCVTYLCAVDVVSYVLYGLCYCCDDVMASRWLKILSLQVTVIGKKYVIVKILHRRKCNVFIIFQAHPTTQQI